MRVLGRIRKPKKTLTTELNRYLSILFSTDFRLCCCCTITNLSVSEIALGAFFVASIFLARFSRRLTVEDACSRMTITLGVVLIRSLARAICVPGRLPSGSGLALNLRVHEKVVKTQ